MAAAIAVNTSASTVGPDPGTVSVAACKLRTRCRSRAGNTCSNFTKALTDVA
jgi:hypothetical protein